MPSIILKAPHDIYQEVNLYEAELEEIDKFKNKLKRLFFKKKKKKEVEDDNINTLKKCRYNLQRLSYEYREDDKLYRKIQKVLIKCNKMCKSYKIEDVSVVPNCDKTMYGSKIKILISSCTYLINQAIEECRVNTDASDFVKSIENYYSQIKSNLTKIEYIDMYVAKSLAVFDILGTVFKKNHWKCVTEFQESTINSLKMEKEEIKKKETLLRAGKISWKEAHKALEDKYKYLNEICPKVVENWEERRYFSGTAMKKTIDEDDSIHSIIYKNGDIFTEFKLNFKLSEDIKNMIKEIVDEDVKVGLGLIPGKTQTKDLCEEIMENNFNDIILSIKYRKLFEESCRKIYVIDKQSKEIRFTDAGKSLSELKKIDSNIINRPCTMYEAVHQGEVNKMFPDGKVDYMLVNSNGSVVFNSTLGNNPKKAFTYVKALWCTRGMIGVDKAKYFGLKKGTEVIKMDVPGVINV